MNSAQVYASNFLTPKNHKKAWDAMLPESTITDQQVVKINRGERLAEVFSTEGWREDVIPLLKQLYEDIFVAVKQGKSHVDGLIALDRFLEVLHARAFSGFEAYSGFRDRTFTQPTTLPTLPSLQ